ncbi:hypothetical protein D3C77_34290 [compost metagenome]
MALFLIRFVTGCASDYAAVEFVPCQHPLVDVRSAGGLAKGLLDYADAIDTCNTLNGQEPSPTKE